MISIITAYYNRKVLFVKTLQSIAKSAYKDFELIAVDDASCDDERIEDLRKDFSFLKVIRLTPKRKWYYNSCIPFNIGISHAKGDIIMLQNPECLHICDILSYMSSNVNDSNYITTSVYSIDRRLTEQLKASSSYLFFKDLPQCSVKDDVGWYNHSIYNPTYYHFCSAITKKNMDILGGFDKIFADGVGYEDVDFVYRIKKLGLKLIINDDVSVIHQWHPKVYNVHLNRYRQLYIKNKNLFEKMKKEGIYQ